MSIEVMELISIFSKNYSKEDAQTIVRDIQALISEHNKTLATREDIKESELRLTKEIESVRLEIEQVRGEIKEVDLRLIKEIEHVRGEIKEVELRLTKEIESVRLEVEKVRSEIEQAKSSTIKWVVGWMVGLIIAQTGAITTIFLLLK
ncbi:MAG: hypothetical protein QXI61_06480 [Nitrososphaerota archaeon]